MKKKTHKRLRAILYDLNVRKAYAVQESVNRIHCYYPPKGGWSELATIDGVPLEYVPDHDWEVLKMREEGK